MIYAENILVCILIPLILAALFTRKSDLTFAVFFAVGMAICLLSAYISAFIDTVFSLGTENTSVYISPMVEETMKMLPVLFYLYIFEPEDMRLYTAAVSLGAGFATFENCCYLLTAGTSSLRYMLIRGLSVGVMHIISILFGAIGIIQMRRFRAVSIPLLVGTLSVSASYHALYNMLVSDSGIATVIGYLIPPLTAAALLLMSRRIMKKA